MCFTIFPIYYNVREGTAVNLQLLRTLRMDLVLKDEVAIKTVSNTIL